ncbi:MAG TPA: Glu/Leu/Phe/Val dehydrogenase, partial [Planctomycetes bacterium]|nr:Glu/Leu/Phe/Val dehydrogenase [Planctomycetota bacterium]
VVTGKPLALGGSLGRHEATGRGVMISAREALKRLGMRPEDTKVVVQGSGNVGGIGALLMHREGYTITSLSDMYGSIHNPNGLDVPNVLEYLSENKKLEGFPDAEAIPNENQLELPCD